MKRIDHIIAERDALTRQWQRNVRDRAKIEARLDALTHALTELTGLELLLGGVPSMFAGGLGGLGGRRRRRRI